MFFIKAYRYPEVLFNRHVFALFETSDFNLNKSVFYFLSSQNTILTPMQYTMQIQKSQNEIIYLTKDIIESL